MKRKGWVLAGAIGLVVLVAVVLLVRQGPAVEVDMAAVAMVDAVPTMLPVPTPRAEWYVAEEGPGGAIERVIDQVIAVGYGGHAGVCLSDEGETLHVNLVEAAVEKVDADVPGVVVHVVKHSIEDLQGMVRMVLKKAPQTGVIWMAQMDLANNRVLITVNEGKEPEAAAAMQAMGFGVEDYAMYVVAVGTVVPV